MSKIKIFSLGGLNENGKNMYVVEVDSDIFVFDAGLKYADDGMLGVDYILPNYDYLKQNANRIKGIFITHGHEGQMGAVPDIVRDIKNIKVYGTTFTIQIIKQDLMEENLPTDCLCEIKAHKKIIFGKNSIFPVSLTHSVPDAVGYVLNTEDGAIFYTGNFVFDPTMSGAYGTDIGKLAYVGKQGVLCLMSESLYSEKKGFTSPNHRISTVIKDVLAKNDGRILFNILSAQLARITELFTELNMTERKVVIMGKTLENMVYNAIDMKYLNFDKSRIVDIHHANDENIVVIISDDREKPFSNLNRIIKGFDKFIKLKEDDTVIFASPIYDGMEKSATKIYDEVSKIGSNLVIIPSKKYLGHHASREDLMLMLDLMKPKYYFPVIGEYRHQVENAKNALAKGIPEENILLRLNGETVQFINGKLNRNIEKIKVDETLIDGKTVGDIGELVLKDRELLGENGVAIINVVIDKKTKNILAGPDIYTKGFIYAKDNNDLIKEVENISRNVILENIKDNFVDFTKIKLGIRDKVGKYLFKQTDSKPMILIVLQEI